jgi:plastocyanin
MKKKRNVAIMTLAMGILCVCLTACGISNSNEVHMSSTNFVLSSITIHKGEYITLVNDDSSSLHVIDNGRWLDTTQIPDDEPGAPIAQDVQVSANVDAKIGPFNEAGTFHYYCSVHPGMNLTVIVK